jgi:uncharacterized coiled-coil protein SlyX
MQLQVVRSSIRRLERDDADLTRYANAARQQVQDRYDALVAWGQRARDDILRDVTAREDDARERMRAEKDAASATMESLSTLVSRVARAAPDNPDVIWLRSDLKAALLSDNRLSQLEERSERQEAAWDWSYDVTDADVISRDVTEAYIGRIVRGGSAANMKPPLSLIDLSKRVENVEIQTSDQMKNLETLETKTSEEVNALKSETTDLKTLATSLSSKLGKYDYERVQVCVFVRACACYYVCVIAHSFLVSY